MNAYLPFRERVPHRLSARGQLDELDDDDHLTNTLIFRAITFNSEFLNSSGARFVFTDYADFSAVVDEYAEPFPPHYKQKEGRYAPRICNPTAYGRSFQGNKQVDHVETYFGVASQFKDWVREWEDFRALPVEKQKKKTSLQYTSMFAFFCKKFLSVKGVGHLISILIVEDLVYRKLVDFPSTEQFANVILTFSSKLGSCKLLMRFGVISDNARNSQSNVEAFCNLYNGVASELGDAEVHLMPDIFHFEYALFKLLRVREHSLLQKMLGIPR